MYQQLTGNEIDIQVPAHILNVAITIPHLRVARAEAGKVILAALREQAGIVITPVDGKLPVARYEEKEKGRRR